MFDNLDTVHCLRLKISFQKLDVFILSQKWERDNLHWWPFRKSCVCNSAHQTKSVPSIYIHTVRNHLRDITELSTSKITNFSSFIKLNLPNRLYWKNDKHSSLKVHKTKNKIVINSTLYTHFQVPF